MYYTVACAKGWQLQYMRLPTPRGSSLSQVSPITSGLEKTRSLDLRKCGGIHLVLVYDFKVS